MQILHLSNLSGVHKVLFKFKIFFINFKNKKIFLSQILIKKIIKKGKIISVLKENN